MAPCFSKYLNKKAGFIVLGVAASSSWVIAQKYRKSWNRSRQLNGSEGETRPGLSKSNVNINFLKQLLKIVKVVVSGWTSSEVGYILLVTVILVIRTYCDLWMVEHISASESLLVALDRKKFLGSIVKFLLYFPVFAIINNLLKYAKGELKLGMRKNLSLHLYKIYLSNLNCYRLSNLDCRIPNADQLLTVDVDKLCDSIVEAYSNISKPLLDIGVFTYKISANVGILPPIMLLTYMVLSGLLLTRLRRPVGRYTITEQTLEGEFRHASTRIANYSEEIAFYNANVQEKETLLKVFDQLRNHMRKFLHFRVIMGFIDNIVGKSLASFIGWLSFALVLSDSLTFNKLNVAKRTEFYYTNGFMLLKLAQTLGRLVLSGHEVTRLASFTSRITELQNTLKDVNEGNYQRMIVTDSATLDPNKGKLVYKNNIIRFDKVPIVTPNGEVLVKELSVEICSGINVLVCGPNGAGKSSIFRILGGLWPLFGGELAKPKSGKLFYVPQKPYMTLGSLRDQITYPHSSLEMHCKGSNEQLEQFLELVQLEYLLERKNGLDAVEDWFDVLSGGEKQRIAMARLFYHKPQFAILDECTSAVSVDVEDVMYSYCRKVGITLLTVSHRKSLWKHHDYVLYLDGQGSYTFNPIVEDMEQFGS